jgi:ATP adenylyltransferase
MLRMAVQSAPIRPSAGARPGCAFCERIAGAIEPSLLPDSDFITWASVGALVDGHVLVMPRTHQLNIAAQASDPASRLLPYVDAVARMLERAYGPTCLFEHGPVCPETAPGCSIDHAHLHLLPWSGSLVALATAAHPELSWRTYSGGLLRGLPPAPDSSYLLVEDSDGRGAVGFGDAIPSQALRRVITRALGRAEEWDWKTHAQLATQMSTIQTLTAT